MRHPPARPRQQTATVAEALARGISLLKEEKFRQAESVFSAILKKVPAHPDARHFLGVLRFRQGRTDDAIDILRAVQRTHPDSPSLLSNLGMVLHTQGKFPEALECLDRALTLQPNFPVAHCNRGNSLKEVGRSEDALESYARAIALAPRYAEPMHGRASVLMEQGHWTQAEGALRECLAIDPRYVEAHISLAVLLLQLDRESEALVQAQAAGKLEESPGFPHYRFGALLARCALTEQAQKHLKIALEHDPVDRHGARLLLATLGAEPLPDRLSDSFVNHLYAKRAAEWDRMMVQAQYSGARLVAETLLRFLGGAKTDLLDAGCGTGLVGVLLRDAAGRLDGVDLSANMLRQAAQKGAYRTLYERDLVDFLECRRESYDAITCAGTLIHFGDLRRPLRAAWDSLRGSGLLVFTLLLNESEREAYAAGDLEGYAQGGCYVHGAAYVETVAQRIGFEVLQLDRAVHEYHYGKAVPGLIIALRRPPA